MKKTGFLLFHSILPGGKTESGSAPLFLFAGFWINSFGVSWVGSNGVVGFFVHSLQRFTVNAVFNVFTELFGVGFFVVLLQFIHVFSNVATEDVFAVGFSIEVLFFVVVAWKSFGGVRDIEATVDGTF